MRKVGEYSAARNLDVGEKMRDERDDTGDSIALANGTYSSVIEKEATGCVICDMYSDREAPVQTVRCLKELYYVPARVGMTLL